MTPTKKLGAEFLGTFVFVLGGCGSAVLAAAFPDVGIGLLGVALAFGLTVLTMAYAIGHISGCHLNPAVSIGLWSGGRFSASEIAPYIGAQVAGGDRRRGDSFCDCFRPGGFRCRFFGICLQRIRRALSGRIQPCCSIGHGNRDDVHFPDHHHGCDG